MSIWDAAGKGIDRVFADPDRLTYTGGGLTAGSIAAIRLDEDAPDFAGPGQTARTITYEVEVAAFSSRPAKNDTFIHRGRRWRVIDRKTRDEIGKYHLIVQDDGAAP